MEDMLYRRERNGLKISELVILLVHVQAILCSMYETYIATDKESDTLLQLTDLSIFQTQGFKQNSKWTAEATNIGKYV